TQRGEVVAEVVREHGDELFGRETTTLLERGAGRVFEELRAVGQYSHPPGDGAHQLQVALVERVVTHARELEHTPALVADHERRGERRPHAHLLDAFQLSF